MEKRIWHSSYDSGVPPEADFEDMVIPDLLRRAAKNYPDTPALLFLNASMTYRELETEVARLATALANLGVGKDSRVAVHLPNLPQTVISTFAVFSLGAQCVMTNPLYVPREIEHQWNDAGCETAITTDFLFERRLRADRWTGCSMRCPSPTSSSR